MGKPPMRYERPRLEVEYDQAALTTPGCCRFVPVVLRVCGVPLHKQVRLEVTVERMRVVKDGVALDDYTERPTMLRLTQRFQEYVEGKLELLARGHGRETGTIGITMSSPSGTLLSHVVLRFDSRQSKPIVEDALGFTSLTFVPSLRSDAERESLHGYLPFPPARPSWRANTPSVPLNTVLPTPNEAATQSLWERLG